MLKQFIFGYSTRTISVLVLMAIVLSMTSSTVFATTPEREVPFLPIINYDDIFDARYGSDAANSVLIEIEKVNNMFFIMKNDLKFKQS